MPRGSKVPQTRPPIRRMLFIHEELKHGRYPNCVQLGVEFELKGVRTILRDIAFMKDQLLLPIDYDASRRGYFYTRQVDQFPGVTVSESELFALLVAQKAVAHYRGTPFHQPLQTALEKLTDDLDPAVAVHLEDLGAAMDIRVTGPDEVDEETFQIVCRAVQQHRPLEFRYRKLAAKGFEKRRLHPYQLVSANHRWYLIGHDLRRDALRAFVIGRIQDPEILDGAFVRPKDFRITDYLRNSFGIFKGQDDFEVVLELDRWAADILRGRRWHASQQVTELPGGEIRISFRLDSLEEIEPWVLSWGAHATVIRPKALADRVSAAADAVRKKYGKPAKARNGQDQRELGLKANAARRPLTTNVVPRT